MDVILWSIAIVASAVFILQTLSMLLGGFFDSSADFDIGTELSDLISFKGLLHFTIGFSWCMVLLGTSSNWTITMGDWAMSLGSGVVFFITMLLLYKLVYTLGKSRNYEPIENLEGRVGLVYLPPSNSRKNVLIIRIEKDGAIIEVDAIIHTSSKSSQGYNTGDTVRVMEVVGGIVYVTNQI